MLQLAGTPDPNQDLLEVFTLFVERVLRAPSLVEVNLAAALALEALGQLTG